MPDQNEPLSSERAGAGQLPPIGVAVWVQCEGYRTLAYRDDKGVWRSLGNGKELKRIIKVEGPDQWPGERR